MPHALTILAPSELAAAVAVAAQRLGQTATPTPDGLLADLALGRLDRVRTHLRTSSALPLVAARYHAWTADLQTIAAVWDHLRAATLRMLSDTDVSHALRAATCTELERSATDLGDVHFAATLHRCARAQAQAAWHMSATCAHDLNEDAAMILHFVHHTLGLEPDAPRNRLRVRPRLAHNTQLHVRDIAFAGGRVRVECERAGDMATYRVAQDAGATPCTVLLEPLADAPVRAAYVDDTRAALDSRTTDEGVVVPVQLVLDHERTLRLELEA